MNLPFIFPSHFLHGLLHASKRRGFRGFLLHGALCAVLFLAPGAHAAPTRTAYVIGSLDGSVARVDLETGIVDPSVATTGAVPNRIEASADGTFALITASAAD